MDNKAFYKLSYGVFLLSTADGDTKNGCITNTCIQVASNPTRVAISCINANYTTELLKKSGKFTISILDNTVSFDTIKHFGLQSGRSVDKFASFEHELSPSGIPYITKGACAVLHCHTLSSTDLTSHTMFIAEVDDAEVLSSAEALTYSYYQSNIKPKQAAQSPSRKIVGWRCKVCGYTYDGEKLPADFLCPLCGHPAEDFEPIFE